jgi:RNA polymerase sigma-54 factor
MSGMRLAHRTDMRTTPSLLNLARLLALPSMSLSVAVRQELAANPALEEFEPTAICPQCGRPMVEELCLACLHSGIQEERGSSIDERWPFVAAPQNPAEALLADLMASLPATEQPIAQAIVGNLDDRGFLATSPAAIARSMGVARSRVEAVVAMARRLGPPGVAASSARECLLAQLDVLEGQGVSNSVARAIVTDHLEDLSKHRHHVIARLLKVGVGDVERARDFIQRHLWPYPFADAEEAGTPDFRQYRHPDVAIRRAGEGFQVEVLQSATRWLRVSPIYADLAQRANALEEAERAHVVEHVARARSFIRNLLQREQTLRRVTEAIIVRQDVCLRSGPEWLVPLTRLQIASDVELHVSTVSRAVLDKVAHLPLGELWPFADFFGGGQAVVAMIRDLLATSAVPLTDQQLTDILVSRGHPIARRTVTSYRQKLGIGRQRDRRP